MSNGSSAVLKALANRRSYYALRKQSPIPDSKIRSILSQIALTTPSTFNSQSSRMLVLLKKEHDKLWDIVQDSLRAHLGPEKFNKSASTIAKLAGFKAGYGTILFYEDEPVISALKDRFPAVADKFGTWSQHTNAMHQVLAWVALEAEGFGANLQHYNPIIDEKIAATYSVPPSWKLHAQLVFGAPDGDRPAPKEKKPLAELIRFEGADE